MRWCFFVCLCVCSCSAEPSSSEGCREAGCDVDEDGDGFPRTNPGFLCCDCDCTGLADCNDEDPDIRPDRFEGDDVVDPAGDGVDRNCDGVD